MRVLTTLLSLGLLTPVAFAERAPPLAPIVERDTPERCRPLAKRANVPEVSQAMSARIALAGCIADARVAELSLIDGQESMLAIDAVVAPPLALLDSVIEAGDPSTKIMALRAKADLYTQLAAKMMNTVPAPANTSPEAATLRELRRQIVDAMVMPWREQVRAAHQTIVDLGRAHPELIRNPVVQGAIQNSERELAIALATS